LYYYAFKDEKQLYEDILYNWDYLVCAIYFKQIYEINNDDSLPMNIQQSNYLDEGGNRERKIKRQNFVPPRHSA
jgi:hypothetical protein